MKRRIADIARAPPLSQLLRGKIAISLSNVFDSFSPIPAIRLADSSTRLADFQSVVPGGCISRHCKAAEFGWGQICRGLEGAVERPDRLETCVHRNCQHRDFHLFGVDQRCLGFPDPEMIEKRIEIAVTEAFIDELPQPVFRYAKLGG